VETGEGEAMERYQLGTWNAFLATRERGRQVREDVRRRLKKVPPGAALTLDFSGVDGITVSFGDEFLAKLIRSREPGDDRGILIEGANDHVQETLEIVLARRNVAVATINTAGELEMLGQPGPFRHTNEAAMSVRA
jgi:hypothetical protein